jgi:chromosome segregation ATPase
MIRKSLLEVTILSVTLAACTSPNEQSSTGQTVAEGAGIGVLGGALLGGLLGGKQGAIIGGLGGGLLGAAAGGYVAQQKTKYASIEARIAGERQLVAQATSTAQSQTAASAAKLRVADAQLAELQRKRGDRARTEQAAEVMLTGLQHQRADLESSRKGLETRIQNEQAFIAETEKEIGNSDPQKSAQLAHWKADIPAMQAALGAMTDQIADVTTMETRVQQVRSYTS